MTRAMAGELTCVADNGYTDTRVAPVVTKTVKVCCRKESLNINVNVQL